MSLLDRSIGLDRPERRGRRIRSEIVPAGPLALELVACGLEFGVTLGGLGRSGLAREIGSFIGDGAMAEVSLQLQVHADGRVETATGRRPVRAEGEFRLGGDRLSPEASSFAIVGGLRGMLTSRDGCRHLDLADDSGPWLRCSVAAKPAASEVIPIRPDAISAYVWLRPVADWRIPGGTATPRVVSWREGAEPAGSGAIEPRSAAGS